MAATTITREQKDTFITKLKAEIYGSQIKSIEEILISSGLDYYRIFVSENDEKLLAKLDHNYGTVKSINLFLRTASSNGRVYSTSVSAHLGATRPFPINFEMQSRVVKMELKFLTSSKPSLQNPYGATIDNSKYNEEAFKKYIDRYGETIKKLHALKAEESDFEYQLYGILKNVRSLNSLKKIDSDLYDHWIRIIGDPTPSKALALIPDSIKDTIHKHNEAKKEEAEKIAEVESKSTNKEVAA